MFTGLIEEIGKVRSITSRGDGATLVVDAALVTQDLKTGDSVSIDGACQTVVGFDTSSFTVEAVRETMQRTKFNSWSRGTQVNLERAARPMDRIGGHIVQGHVDRILKIIDIRQLKGSWRFVLELPSESRKFIVEKGSVALDGISLTVASVNENSFEVEIIPHTIRNTTLQFRKAGDRMHVEWDVLAKYIDNMLNLKRDENDSNDKRDIKGKGGLTEAKLAELGY